MPAEATIDLDWAEVVLRQVIIDLSTVVGELMFADEYIVDEGNIFGGGKILVGLPIPFGGSMILGGPLLVAGCLKGDGSKFDGPLMLL